MGIAAWLRPRLLDVTMRQMNDMRPDTVGLAEGDVIEVGFGTGINLDFYGSGVKSLVAIDPNPAEGFEPTEARLSRAPFPVERSGLRADKALPYDDARFDVAVSTWTLCSIPEPLEALAELHRVLRPGGRFVFVEHLGMRCYAGLKRKAAQEGLAEGMNRKDLDAAWRVQYAGEELPGVLDHGPIGRVAGQGFQGVG